ncbi:MAG: polyribonucleotide nucleotidyltransferase [Myxococcales bacterium]|nr:polyribonucleotide nucleotidyltransferase [Myxococcales bacterium]|tara:strand:- start:1091 stop:3268 length:2178 start_codon:yes stop_codon:yes gene_type:complete
MSFDELGKIELGHNSEKFHSVSVDCNDAPMTFEMGRVAKQTAGAAMVRWGDSVVLVTACGASSPREGMDFFPLTCEYVEKTYAAGKIPGGYFKREARPREAEILNARIIDRSIRPLFPDGYRNETQVIATVLSHDGVHDTDVMALNGASMALHASNLPFAEEAGPIAGVRVVRLDGEWVAHPTLQQRQAADVDMMVAVSKDAIVMVEGGADEVSESDLLDALFFAKETGQANIQAFHQMREAVGKEKMAFEAPVVNEGLMAQVRELALNNGLKEAIVTKSKLDRYAAIDAAKDATMAALQESLGEEAFAEVKGEASGYFGDVKKKMMRTDCVQSSVRLDGRAYGEIRNIDNEVAILPRTHGSALFTRGETQSIVTCTLGAKDDEQRIDTLMGDVNERFMLHYNFPPFCVGEARMLRSTSRRELGHGNLAHRALKRMVPDAEGFPYTVRIVSEITESNGSSSMATVCGGTLAMMDAGVPLKAPVAGIAMGLIKEGDGLAVLSDILGDEDHLGDMDFKVCGTENGVTAIQMDIKIDGLTREIMTQALEQAREGRLHILNKMQEAISGPRAEMSPHSPRIISLKINPDKIRDVIGPGGKVVKDITARTGVKLDILDDGTVSIFSADADGANQAKQIVEDITREAEVGLVYKGLVKRVVDFGAFVEIFPGTDGLVHISELAHERTNQVTDVLDEGDEVKVVCMKVDRDGKIRLSRKRCMDAEVGSVIDF